MHVSLLAHTEAPIGTVAMAARLCYSSEGNPERMGLGGLEAEELVRKLIEMGHESPLEHASFTFGISGISRACSHQLVRHRLASYSQRSQRYVSEQVPSYVLPSSIAKAGRVQQYHDLMDRVWKTYNELVEAGVPKEDARYVLPNATETSLIMTVNARELRHIFGLRLCRRAQWEVREMVRRMRSLVTKRWSVLFERSGPSCFAKGQCEEGRFSCGRPVTRAELETEWAR